MFNYIGHELLNIIMKIQKFFKCNDIRHFVNFADLYSFKNNTFQRENGMLSYYTKHARFTGIIFEIIHTSRLTLKLLNTWQKQYNFKYIAGPFEFNFIHYPMDNSVLYIAQTIEPLKILFPIITAYLTNTPLEIL